METYFSLNQNHDWIETSLGPLATTFKGLSLQNQYIPIHNDKKNLKKIFNKPIQSMFKRCVSILVEYIVQLPS